MTNGNTHSIDTSAVHTGQGWTGKVSFLQGRQDQNLRGGAGGGGGGNILNIHNHDRDHDHNHCLVLSNCSNYGFPELERFESVTSILSSRGFDHFCGAGQGGATRGFHKAGRGTPLPCRGASIPVTGTCRLYKGCANAWCCSPDCKEEGHLLALSSQVVI